MIFVYNFLQAGIILALFPILILVIATKEKYRTRIGARLGIGLKQILAGLEPGTRKIIWIHALSVGEVTSALPLVKGLQDQMEVCVVFSAATKTGHAIAQEKIKDHVDVVIPAPLDLLPVINHFVELIRPDMFILVETDFWPNWINCLSKKNIPLVLVNGRISKSSFAKYQRMNIIFKKLFQAFSLMSMQTETDSSQIHQLGATAEKVKTLGNLKYDSFLFNHKEVTEKLSKDDLKIPDEKIIWVCGSTHLGEEELIIKAFKNMLQQRDDLFLLLAPRDPNRGEEIQQLASSLGLQSRRRTHLNEEPAPILILDTIGELADCYRLAKVAFIGGSLLDYGGHNPLEASVYGVPVVFGPNMSDFLEISRDLQENKGGMVVHSAEELEKNVLRIINSPKMHQEMSQAALNLVNQNSGVIHSHLREISALLHLPAR